ncbi:nucleotide exchange factor GrpE [Desulfosoma caldarium]|uniref:Protein GrpE n=1 Tax=Desulfosoma caldarium TaxID=610254 RepID=A0A3N1UT52_9BACT|nr:nucleotide exchange factor GrpE [Desulfosoma caldarium]ROQ93323.1 molecular chaperone GrpE [Desulfosoma caldarium]
MKEEHMSGTNDEPMVETAAEGHVPTQEESAHEAPGDVDLKALLEEKDAEIQSLKDKILRQAADMENTRKRLERDRNEAIAYANESLIRELLSVVDNLERAIQHAEQDTDNQTLLEGVKMTHKHFLDTLARFGCRPFESKGKDFDPCFHEAILQQASEEFPPNTVIQEFQRGYTLHDRLLRPALVAVSKGTRTASCSHESDSSA